MILPLRYYPDPILRKEARQVEVFDDSIAQIIENMKESLIKYRGLGLAANQVGVDLAIALILLPEEERIIPAINPRVLAVSGREKLEEGCLSFPRLYLEIERPKHIKFACLTPQGEEKVIELDGIIARAALHEIDHLNGVLIIDRISSTKRHLIKRELEEIAQKYGGRT